jgi:hypothetical protein
MQSSYMSSTLHADKNRLAQPGAVFLGGSLAVGHLSHRSACREGNWEIKPGLPVIACLRARPGYS